MKTVVQQPMNNWQLIRALVARKTVPFEQFKPSTIRINYLSTNAEQRAAFRLFFDCQQIPPSYLFNISYRYIGQLLAQAHFSSKLMGLIHLSSQFQLLESVNWRDTFDLILSFTACNRTDKGLIYRIEINLIQRDKACLVCVNEILDKDLSFRSSQKREHNPACGELIDSIDLDVKKARAYAKLSGDFNPIHLSSASAKLLGMKNCVMHGMFNLHWSLTKIPLSSGVKQINAKFNQPCFLPREVKLVGMDTGTYGLFSNNLENRHLHLTLM
ncbi:hypothetical protein HII17_02480 [Thalassotalea sp. M1531]|uniref:MaoC-like domain-containing protein n=1 Tax=Thalassotalea algicola TaxID=2716224 RepID=A0A7Y0LAB0_9GAMM|nr:MaoC/PaaZ C-terminal domain-containing protein [Thalassotalea algicola]NMP30417.1 hypothetical protein [Thalassotalea algicola]